MRTTSHKLVTTLALAAAMATPLARAAAPSAESIASDKIRDLTATLRVVDANFDELKKIGGDFATSYRFKRMEVTYKNPNRTRLEAKVLGTSVVLIYNGGTKMVKVPFRKEVKDIAHEPGKKMSLLDFGIFARDYLATDYKATHLRNEGALQVYRLSQRNTDNPTYRIVWVNPKTAIIERQQVLSGENQLKKEMRYKNPVQIRPGIWVPGRIEIYNQFGKLGGVQAVEGIKVNQGVDDSKFALS
jgi:outer membrane lipoprotein-sorting protein